MTIIGSIAKGIEARRNEMFALFHCVEGIEASISELKREGLDSSFVIEDGALVFRVPIPDHARDLLSTVDPNDIPSASHDVAKETASDKVKPDPGVERREAQDAAAAAEYRGAAGRPQPSPQAKAVPAAVPEVKKVPAGTPYEAREIDTMRDMVEAGASVKMISDALGRDYFPVKTKLWNLKKSWRAQEDAKGVGEAKAVADAAIEPTSEPAQRDGSCDGQAMNPTAIEPLQEPSSTVWTPRQDLRLLKMMAEHRSPTNMAAKFGVDVEVIRARRLELVPSQKQADVYAAMDRLFAEIEAVG